MPNGGAASSAAAAPNVPSASLTSLPPEVLALVWRHLSPYARRALRATCRWAVATADLGCVGVLALPGEATVSFLQQQQRFQHAQQEAHGGVAPATPPPAHGLLGHAVGDAAAARRVLSARFGALTSLELDLGLLAKPQGAALPWPKLLSGQGSLSCLTLTTLCPADLSFVAATFPNLAHLSVWRAGGHGNGRGGKEAGSAAAPWALEGLTFRPLLVGGRRLLGPGDRKSVV